MSNILGFTGTRSGVTSAQRLIMREVIAAADCIVHGDCIGADAEAHAIALQLSVATRLRPCNLSSQRAFCVSPVTFPAEAPLTRNAKIVADCNRLVAVVSGPEQTRSGTWSTVRRARAARKPIMIIWPDGCLDDALTYEPDNPLVRRMFRPMAPDGTMG